MVGNSLSHYKILDELGRGGMGIVYKAEDTKLDRTVAIKVLPSAALASEDDRARFYREAKAAAQLHHPHIASVFEIDEAVPSDAPHGTQPSPFIAMEYIEGKTLDAKVKEGPLKLKDAIRIASEVASALEAAHKKDIVHRDIKSQNVMLTEEGSAKVLDFGLAQTAHSTKLTRMGSTLGTIAYMSPEQARSEEVDHRTDIWSLGVVLHEMIAGKNPFPGDYEQAAIYSILNEDPEPLTSLRTGVPMNVEWLVNKCLSKKREERYQSARELIVDLNGVDFESLSQTSSISASMTQSVALPSVESTTRFSKQTMVVVVGALALAALAFLLGRATQSDLPDTQSSTTTYLNLVLDEELPLALIGSAPFYIGQKALTLSADGKTLVYVAELPSGATQLVKRSLQDYSSEPLANTEGAYAPFLSPDGQQVGYFASSQLLVIPIAGGTPRPLVDVRNPRGGIWTDAGDIIFAENEGAQLRKISARGGQAEMFSEHNAYSVSLLPDGKHFLATSRDSLFTVSIATGQFTNLFESGLDRNLVSPQYVSSGHLLFMQDAQLMATPFDLPTLSSGESSIPVVEDVRNEALDSAGQYTVSSNGTFVYAPGGDVRVGHLVAVSPEGAEEILPFEPQIYGEMHISPDGTQLAICVMGAKWDIWVYDIQNRTPPRKLTIEGSNYNPVWSPDGSLIYFLSDRDGGWDIYSMPTLSSGATTRLTDDGIEKRPSSVSSDGEWLLFSRIQTETHWDIYAKSLIGEGQIVPIANSNYVEWGSAFSPNGQFLAYHADDSGTYDVYVKSFDDSSERARLSNGGGMDPIWSDDGRFIYYNHVRRVYRVEFDTENRTAAREPELLFEGDYMDLPGIGWAYSSQMDRFVLIRSRESETTSTTLKVVTNWLGDLTRLVPTSQ